MFESQVRASDTPDVFLLHLWPPESPDRNPCNCKI